MHRAPSTTIRLTVLWARSVTRPTVPASHARPPSSALTTISMREPGVISSGAEKSRHAPSLARHYEISVDPGDFGRLNAY
jgi:hypothetical protein